jgi:hypothetical protein
VDFSPSAEYFKSETRRVLYANHAPLVSNIPFGKGLTQVEREGVRHICRFVCIRLRAEYRDARMSARYADFGFCVEHDGLGFLPKYNDAN